MLRIVAMVLTAGLAVPVLAQTVPVLPTTWEGRMTGTQTGPGTTVVSRHSPVHPDHVGADAAKGWKSFNNPYTLRIVRQDGRHIEANLVSDRHTSVWVATLSADGKTMQATGPTAKYLLQIDGNRMSGCGSAHYTDGTYSALCLELTAK